VIVDDGGTLAGIGGPQGWRAAGLVAFVVAGFLLVSMGGAIVAAPITVPLMWMAASRHPTRPFRVAAMVLSALTVAEAVWALTYVTVDEAQPWIWVLPALAALAAVAVCRRLAPARR
jgi:hypothetical protein